MATELEIKPKPQKSSGLTPYGKEAIMAVLMEFVYDEDGASAVEYALLLSLIALTIISSITVFGQAISNSFVTSTMQMFGSG
jgi:Flp pilus assembly pilin Flp